MRTLKTSRRELEHVAVCVTGEVSAEFIRDIQETMRRENQRRRDAGRPGMSYTVSGGEGSPEEWIRKALNQDLGNGAARTVRCVQGPVVRLALTGRQDTAGHSRGGGACGAAGQGHPGRRRCRGMSRQLIAAVLGLALLLAFVVLVEYHAGV